MLRGEGNENGKKKQEQVIIGKKQLCTCSTLFLVHFFAFILSDYNVELPETPSLGVALLSLFFCLSLSLYSKFVDMTFNLSLILKTTRIQKHFPLSVFVLIDSLVVSASHDVGGRTLYRQNKLTFSIGLHEFVCTDGRAYDTS